jgi:sulfite reductase alpha subunit-like flavoprotein
MDVSIDRKIVYLQEYLKKNKKLIYELIMYKKAFIYICGSVEMSKDVINIILDVIRDYMNDDDKDKYEFDHPDDYLNNYLIKNKRLQREIWN